ncbi:MAG TPA: hypothetical protein DIT99_06455 [Candidatus Latescibacteria bacterium]|nr:hypothetical protein [Candidatus Latescibacterota bacterium]
MICIIPIGAEWAVGADESVTVHILQEGCVLGIDGVHYCGIAPPPGGIQRSPYCLREQRRPAEIPVRHHRP